MFALESAMDELALACGIDPVELRIRNEPDDRPRDRPAVLSRATSSSACARAPSASAGSDAPPRRVRERALAARHRRRRLDLPGAPGAPRARPRTAEPDGTYRVRIDAADIGTGARTVLTQIAADALDVPVERVDGRDRRHRPARGGRRRRLDGHRVVGHGDRRRPCRALREQLDEHGGRCRRRRAPRSTRRPASPQAATRCTPSARSSPRSRVDADTGEVRVPRLLGVFAVGRIINPQTGALAADRRHDHGPLDGAARGERDRPAVRRLRQPRLRRVPHRGQRRRRGARRGAGSTRTTPRQPDGRQGHRRDRHRRAPPRRSPTPSTTPPACASATCRSGRTACSPACRESDIRIPTTA